MERLGLPFEVRPSSYEEKPPAGLPPYEYVTLLAQGKAEAVERRAGDTVVGADTIVCLGREILGKPRDGEDARRCLRALSGRVHSVFTGVAVVCRGETHTFWEETQVEFRPMSDKMIDEYIRTGEPMDKAGAYGIQGYGGRFVKGIRGDFYNVMGLPLCSLSRLFEELGIIDGGERA